MAKKGEGGVHITMESAESDHKYHTVKNKRSNPERLKRRKYDPIVKRHVEYTESKSSK